MSDISWGCASVGVVVLISVLLALAIRTTSGPSPTGGSRGSISYVRDGHVRILRDTSGNVTQTARWSKDFNRGHFEDGGLLRRAQGTGMLDDQRGYTSFKDMTAREQDASIEKASRR